MEDLKKNMLRVGLWDKLPCEALDKHGMAHEEHVDVGLASGAGSR